MGSRVLRAPFTTCEHIHFVRPTKGENVIGQSIQTKRVGLALSGGTLKAAAHVGVLDALEALGIQIDCVAGTSAGSYVAALYAHGVTPQEMVRLVESFPGARLLDYGFPLVSSLLTFATYRMWPRRDKTYVLPAGLLQGRRLEQYFRKTLRKRTTNIPYYVIATDLYSGLPVVYGDLEARGVRPPLSTHRGSNERQVYPVTDLPRVVRGSCSLPGVFTPVRIGEKLLVDGGLRSYVPVEVLRDAGCTHIIAVNLYRLQEEWQPETFAHVLTRSFDIILDETIDADVQGSDVFSLSPNVSHISWHSFRDLKNCIAAGGQAVADCKNELKRFLNSASQNTCRASHTTKTVRQKMTTELGTASEPKRTKDTMLSPVLHIRAGKT